MKKHILIEKAFCYTEPVNNDMPQGYTFLEKKGYWITEQGQPMMLSNDPRKPQTKKCDRETGEDLKGE